MRSTMVTDADGRINHDYDGVALRAEPTQHLKLAHKMAWWCARTHASATARRCDDDAELHWLGWCVEMLYLCAKHFDASRGFRFSTYYCRAVKMEYKKRDEDHKRLVLRMDANGVKRWTKRRLPTVSEIFAPCDEEEADMRGGCRWSRMWMQGGSAGMRPDEIAMEREDREVMRRRLGRYVDDELELQEWDIVRRRAGGEIYDQLAETYGVSRSALQGRMVHALGTDASRRLSMIQTGRSRPARTKRDGAAEGVKEGA